ncbi:glutathione S-transferase family protein [Pigmentiphaga soli]|uniref:Glutathione S-transferase family protein n=1 Tax=Pigmentiphaga soli TaxID=1007095 RepID=A0ABP8HDK9_9BURK
MGFLQNGRWIGQTVGAASAGGEFERPPSVFRNWITADGSAGPTGEAGFRAEAGRYHLYVSLACPWAHRTLIFRRLKGLEAMIPVSVTHWHLGADGWSFEPGEGVVPDTINGKRLLREIYTLADPACSGKVTVPVLWDTRRRTIVSNESADIIRMFNSAFDALGARPGDYYPQALRGEIDGLNERIYATVNNGVYRAGFATSQAAYERAVGPLFETLDWLEARLAGRRYLCGERVTEADWRLFTTLLRFDAVYVGHFKCNLRRLVDYPALWGYARELYQWPGVRETVDFGHIKRHYYGSHRQINPSGIVPAGPLLDFGAPHGRSQAGRG